MGVVATDSALIIQSAEMGGYFTNEVRDRFTCLTGGYQQAFTH